MVSGELRLEAFEAGAGSSATWQEVEKEIRKAAGMGPFTAANMLQLMALNSLHACLITGKREAVIVYVVYEDSPISPAGLGTWALKLIDSCLLC